MGEIVESTCITLLMDSYSDDGNKLLNSLKLAGYSASAVVIDDDGFLPEGMISLYGYFLGDFAAAGEEYKNNGGVNANIKEWTIPGHPRYFNQIEIPEYWEIQASNTDGKIVDKGVERAHIFYAEPRHKRYVNIVEWKDRKDTVRISDHYNKYGALYAKTIFNAKGQKVSKSYFSTEHKEIIVENYVTKDIMLNDENGLKIFRSKADFVAHFLRVSGMEKGRIMYNSLSTSFFSTLQLTENGLGDVMFWQEKTGKDIPGNMQYILNGNAKRTGMVCVQNKASYDKLIELGASADKVKYLGYIYELKRENKHRPSALICTNSDQVMQLEKLVKALPELHFNVAALTEMSTTLMAFDKYENVSLYPVVKPTMQEELFAECDYYLDINRESEILSAVKTAFMNNMLIVGFDEVAHNRNYVPAEHIYKEAEADKMIEMLKASIADRTRLDRELASQYSASLFEIAENYTKILG